jgi:uncharacterized protein
MAIKINDIPPEGLTVEIEESLDLFDRGTPTTPIRAKVTITPEGSSMFHVKGTVNAKTDLECSRCLKHFPFHVTDTAMDFDLLPESAAEQGAEHELVRAELDTEFYEGDEIEPLEFIREQLLLTIPMVPVHSEGCKGLCPVCGEDRNVRECGCKPEGMPEKESPFAVLRKIIKPDKE